MSSIIYLVQGLAPHSRDWKSLYQRLLEHIETLNHLATTPYGDSSTELLKIINDLNTHENSYGIILLLAFQATKLPDHCFIYYFNAVLLLIDNSTSACLQYASKEVATVMRILTDLACKIGHGKSVIVVLHKTLHLISPNPHCLTPVHALLLQACISGQMYCFAITDLNQQSILEVDDPEKGMSIADFLLYFYYAGICYSATKDYQSAIRCFNQAITSPASVISAIVVACIKKVRLVCLIATGKDYELPMYASSCVKVAYKCKMGAYDEIVRCFLNDDDTGMSRAITDKESFFDELNKDQNMGLAKQVAGAMLSYRIQRLTETYMSMSLTAMAVAVGLGSDVKATQDALLDMVASGDIHATIDHKTNMVRFADLNEGQDDSSSAVNEEMMVLMQTKLEEIMDVSAKMRLIQTKLLTSKAYAMKALPTDSSRLVQPYAGSGSGSTVFIDSGDWEDDREMDDD